MPNDAHSTAESDGILWPGNGAATTIVTAGVETEAWHSIIAKLVPKACKRKSLKSD